MHRIAAIAVLILSACGGHEGVCRLRNAPVSLPPALGEISGIALSRAHRGVLWTHNDSDAGALLHAVDTRGAIIGSIEIEGARNRDWEDIAVAPCPSGGPAASCLYVADIGDNRAARDEIGVYVLPEPHPQSASAGPAVYIPLRYPDGPRDAEAVFVTPDARLFVVSKGREHPVTAYRTEPLTWPAAGSVEPRDLLLVQTLTPRPVDLPEQVTGASMTPRGRWIGLRTYSTLQFYRLQGDSLVAGLSAPVAVDPLGEPQGEGIALAEDGDTWLASEAGPQAIAPRLTRLACRLP